MSTGLVAFTVAALAAVGLVVTLGILSLLSGGFHFLLARPKLTVLKSKHGDNGFAFAMNWNASREPAKFSKVKVRLFNAFGSPSQVEVSHEFPPQDESFAADVDMGAGMQKLLRAQGIEKALITVEVTSSNNEITHFKEMRGSEFLKKRTESNQTSEEFTHSNSKEAAKKYYHTVSRSFVADPLPENANKSLKIATNPEFAGDFAAAGGASDAPAENFAVAKVWIEPGCIVCNACEGIFPEVFEVTDTTCLIRPNAPLDDGLRILEAAEACPVEVIKFDKA